MRAPLVLILSGLLVCMTVLVSGCGLPGAPQSPSLHIPRPVQDLHAFRKGNSVVLSWTAPTQNTDGTLVRRPGKMIVSRSVGDGALTDIGEVTLQPALHSDTHPRVSLTDQLGPVLRSASSSDFVTYRITSIGERNRTTGPGNMAQISALPVLPPPSKVELRMVPGGIEVSFAPDSTQPSPSLTGMEFAYRVSRRLDGAKAGPTTVGQVAAGNGPLTLLDSRVEWDSTYEYWVTPVTHWQAGGKSGEVEGEDSPIVKILAHDSFPPAVPSGIQAVYAGDPEKPEIDLTWTPNSDDDLAGYNVYRRTANGQFTRINSGIVKTPSFHDGQVTLGMTFTYAVTAVDIRGNESEKSKETAERVPQK
jgi:hypothetical protein